MGFEPTAITIQHSLTTTRISKTYLWNMYLSLFMRNFTSLFFNPLATFENYNSEIQSMVVCEFMKYLFISTLIVFHDFVISWSIENSLNLFQKRTWDPINIYDEALAKIITDSWNPLTGVTTSSDLDAIGILGPAFSYGVMVAK